MHGPDGSYSLQVFAWPADSRTKIHYHTSRGYLLRGRISARRRALRVPGRRLPERPRPLKENIWQLLYTSTVLACGR
jgi:hypothetical protein